MKSIPVEKNHGMMIEELINQHSILFLPNNELDDSSSLVQPHAFDYIPNFTSDATLVEDFLVET